MGSIPSFLSLFLLHWQITRRSFYALVSLFLLCLLAYNSATIFFAHVPVPARKPSNLASFLPENVTGESRTFSSLSSTKMSSSVQHLVKEDSPHENLNTLLVKNQLPENVTSESRIFSSLPSTNMLSALQYLVKQDSPHENLNTLLIKNKKLVVSTNRSRMHQATRRGRQHRHTMKVLQEYETAKHFESRVVKFFRTNSSSCKFRFFMTWISLVESFGDREMLCVESVFKAHPNGCLIIVSSSMDSRKGMKILRPFLDKRFKVAAMSPDFNYLFKGTGAQAWLNKLKQGHVNPGEVSLGQNLSNLLRMGLLYRFGGIYLDTDVIVLKSFSNLRNAIGAQTVDLVTRNWSRLNNAVMAFDKGHPLLREFIEEFTLTFDGNKWGHNGPYLVSRVVSRVQHDRPGFDFTVLPPMAFYPVDWNKVGSFFHGPKSMSHSKWIFAKLRQIRSNSFAIHLWNKQSRGIKVEKGSIIQHVLFGTCVVCNCSSLSTE